MKIYYLLLLTPILFENAYSQSDTVKPKIDPYGFIDLYYMYNFNQPEDNTAPSFIYNHNRYNEIGVNQAILGVKVKATKYRAALGFHAGTYVAANYAGENMPIIRNIFEANIGYKFNDKLWLDAGIFSSYIGNETSISFDMWTLTRPIMAENYPYYQTGVKLSYEPNPKWMITGLLLNGWQNIIETNANKPIGAQIQYKPNSKILLNTSLFWGKEKAAVDTITEIANRRSFFDFYGIFQLTDKLSTALYFDIGSQRVTAINRDATWYALTGMIRYKPSPKTALCIRSEYYDDPFGVMVLTPTNDRFNTSGISLNIDYFLTENILARIEGKSFLSRNKIFMKENNAITGHTFMLTTSMSIKF